MNKIAIILLICLFNIQLKAQNNASEYYPPVYKNGLSDFHKYLYDSLHYPQVALSKEFFDDFVAVIHVSSFGKVSEVFIKGKENSFKKEVKRVILNMPDWNPATLGGKTIDTTVTQKIYFSLKPIYNLKDTTAFICLRTAYKMLPWTSVVQKPNATVWGQIVNGNAMEEANNQHWIAAYDLYSLAEEKGLTTVDLYYNRAVVKLKLGKIEEACADLKIAIEKGDAESSSLFTKFCELKIE